MIAALNVVYRIGSYELTTSYIGRGTSVFFTFP